MKFEKYLERQGIKSIKSMDAEQFSAFCKDFFTLRKIQHHFIMSGPGCCLFGMTDIRTGKRTEYYITEKQLRSILK